MGRPAGWMQGLTGRASMRSPGKPSLRRDVERQFWCEIAKGLTSEDAALAVGASQAAGSRWFRERGGMPTFMTVPLTGRYLSFPEREEIAVLKGPGRRGSRDRPPAGPQSRDDLAGAAPQRSHARWQVGLSGIGRAVEAELLARRPKTAKLVKNARLREYVQDRLSGQLRRPDGTPVEGPVTAPWKDRTCWPDLLFGKDHRVAALWLAPVRRLSAGIAAMAARSTAPPGFSESARAAIEFT